MDVRREDARVAMTALADAIDHIAAARDMLGNGGLQGEFGGELGEAVDEAAETVASALKEAESAYEIASGLFRSAE